MQPGKGGNPNHDPRTGEFARGSNSGIKEALHGSGSLHVGMSPQRFLDIARTEKFTMLSACNPGHTVSRHENVKATANLMYELNRRGIRYEICAGNYSSTSNKSETAFMCLHDSHFGEPEANDIGTRYGQESVLNCAKGIAKYHYTTGADKGKERVSTRLNAPSDAMKNFTRYGGTKFAFDFDWSKDPERPTSSGAKLRDAFGGT